MRARIAIAIVAVGFVAVAAFLLLGRETVPRAFAWPAGLALTYDLELDATDTAAFGTGGKGATEALETRTRLAGRLRLHSRGLQGGVFVVGMRLVELRAARVEVAGQDGLAGADPTATEALAELRPDGSLVGVRFAPGTPELVQNLLMLVVTETAVTLGAGSSWTAGEGTTQGVAESRYAVVDEGGDGLALERVRERYRELIAERASGRAMSQRAAGKASVSVRGGVLERLVAGETLRAGDETGTSVTHVVSAELVLRSRETMAAAPPSVATVTRRPGELAVSGDFAARQLAMRVDGLTREELLETMAHAARGGRAPDANRFLWRATGLVRQRPELCAELVGLYDRDEADVEGRALILDLLVGAGTGPAQEALRDALGRKRGQGEVGYRMLYQRLGLVAEPDAGTLDLAREHARVPGPEGKAAALASYGAVAGKRLAGGDASAAEDVKALVDGLEQAATPEEQVMHLRAVSNLHLASLEGTIAAYAAAPDHSVRRAAARALHDQRGDLARHTLVDMAGDVDGEVQRQSLMGLGNRRLADDDLSALEAVVARGGVRETGYEALLDAVADDLARPGARAVVEAVLRQPVQNARVLGRAKRMLRAAAE